MKKLELEQFETDTELAHAVARAWLDVISDAGEEVTRCVALSGGRIAKLFFATLAQQSMARGISLGGVHFFWADERCVPALDAESNFRVAQELLFTPLEIGSQNIHRIRGELQVDDAAREASVNLCRVCPASANGLPVFDVIFLGMGEDGHVASLFPDETEGEMNLAQVYRPVVASKPPPNRITLGYGTIAAAQQVWVLASGKGKEAALRDSLSQGSATPLGRVIRMRTNTRVFSDIPA